MSRLEAAPVNPSVWSTNSVHRVGKQKDEVHTESTNWYSTLHFKTSLFLSKDRSNFQWLFVYLKWLFRSHFWSHNAYHQHDGWRPKQRNGLADTILHHTVINYVLANGSKHGQTDIKTWDRQVIINLVKASINHLFMMLLDSTQDYQSISVWNGINPWDLNYQVSQNSGPAFSK